ncbi:hypothetical protein FDP41_000766 [Naegleria fowleri]|uniref:Amine oxidase n=1 Tax=Naegleria fowleri TaxID=5763 RepID=A0A6A5C6E3_NAEFO|nr:uncharacterized protein FDP41_000766 [Naegleria fowleri]KAF0984867.1 hypothetical protein FDP41_000766 [Naegleria fowleri]
MLSSSVEISSCAPTKKSHKLYDVVIIGAGMSGVNVGKLLKEKGLTENVLILEANDYIGGRLRSKVLLNGKATIDIGGQWIGPPQPKVLKLVKELGLSTYPQYFEQEKRRSSLVFPSIGGKKHILRYTGSIPSDPKNVTDEVLLDFDTCIRKIERMANTVPVDAPHECDKAEEYDSQTVQTFMDNLFKTEIAKDFFKTFVVTVFACQPYEMSALFMLWYIAVAGGKFENLMNVRDAAQDCKIYRGSQGIVTGVAEKFKLNVLLNHHVVKIKDEGSLMTVTCKNGAVFQSKYVVTTNLPWTHLGIEYDPPLPSARHNFCQRTPMGYAIKCFMLFKEPFWRKKYDSNGFILSLQPEDYITLTYDVGYKDDIICGICGFVYAEKACEFSTLPREKKIDLLLKQYSETLGGTYEEWKSQFVDYIDKDWGMEPYARGSYGAVTAPGTLVKTKLAFREPLYNRKLFIAGTESASRWIGYMEGAIDAAERVVSELTPLFEGQGRTSKL